MELSIHPGDQTRILSVRGPWRPAYADAMARQNVTGLELWPADGEPADLGFLRDLPALTHFASNLTHRVDYSAVEGLPALRRFKAITPSLRPVNFAGLRQLRHVAMPWDAGYRSVFDAPALQSLAAFDFDAKLAGEVARAPSLQAIDLRNTAIASLAFLRPLKRLRKLRLGLCRKLTDLADLEELGALELLAIAKCAKIASFEPIKYLERLKYLFLVNGGRMPDITFIEPLQYLRLFNFDAQVENNDLGPIDRAPNLKVSIFPGRKTYFPPVAIRGVSSTGQYELAAGEQLFLGELDYLP